MLKKYKNLIILIVAVLILGSGIFYYNWTAWERDLTVKFVGYDESAIGDPIDVYEITNNTNRAISKVSLIFNCKSYTGRKLKYEDGGHGYIPPGTTKEFRVNGREIREFNEENGVNTYYDHELVRVKYKK